MISANHLVNELINQGFTHFLGVPCSYLQDIIREAEKHGYLNVNNEGEAIAIACGMYLANIRPVVLIQNSGLGNMLNPLTSLIHMYKIPVLLIISNRETKLGDNEPQHELMGKITNDILRLLGIGYTYLNHEYKKQIKYAREYMDKNVMPYALIINKGIVEKELVSFKKSLIFQNNYNLSVKQTIKNNSLLKVNKALSLLFSKIQETDVIVTTTGHLSRNVYSNHDRDGNLYIMGSMGCCSSVGLGISLIKNQKNVFIFDGDGSVLMRLESLVSIGNLKPSKYFHIVFDNGMYESTGGQKTMSNNVDLCAIARLCGYKFAFNISNEKELSNAIEYCYSNNGPGFIRIHVKASDKVADRPPILPCDLKSRFMFFLNEGFHNE